VNDVRHDDPQCVAPFVAPPPGDPPVAGPRKRAAEPERQGTLF